MNNYIDILSKRSNKQSTIFDLGRDESENGFESFVNGCADAYIDSIMSGYASI